jgi:hypothetical protein
VVPRDSARADVGTAFYAVLESCVKNVSDHPKPANGYHPKTVGGF